MIDRPLVLLLLGLCAALGGLVFTQFEPDAPRELATTEISLSRTNAAGPRSYAASVETQVETVLARPLFNPTRRPPAAAASIFDSGSGLENLRLAGIITAPGRRLAIFADTDGKPLAFAEGQVVNGWRIHNITPRELSLSVAGGMISLQPQASPVSAESVPAPKLTFDRVLPDQETRDDE